MRAGMIDVDLMLATNQGGIDWGNIEFGQIEAEKAVDAAVRFAAIPELADPVVPVSVRSGEPTTRIGQERNMVSTTSKSIK
jgi:hypothetical protein